MTCAMTCLTRSRLLRTVPPHGHRAMARWTGPRPTPTLPVPITSPQRASSLGMRDTPDTVQETHQGVKISWVHYGKGLKRKFLSCFVLVDVT